MSDAMSPSPWAATPPPSCPAHAGGAAVRRLHDSDAEADPMAFYTRLREEHGAVAPVLAPGDVAAWLVLGYHENLEVLRNPRLFSSDPDHFGQNLGPAHPVAPLVTKQSLISFADGEEHRRLREAVTDSLSRFNPRSVRKHITHAANTLVDAFCSTGRADLVADFAALLPMSVMARLLGADDVPPSQLAAACRDLLRATETAVASAGFLLETMQNLVETKKAEPGSDFTSWLLRHGAGLGDEEVVHQLRQLLVASNEGTTNLIAETLNLLLTDTRFRARLDGGNMSLAEALDDVLWNNAPLRVLPARFAVEDTTLGGHEIRKGDWVLNGLAAGNVDPQIRPDLTESMQGNRSHLSFSGGPHGCPGESIARAIAEVSIDVLLSRMPDIRPASFGEASRTRTWTSSHLDALPVVFTPRNPALRPAPEAIPEQLPEARPLPAEPAPAPEPVARPWWRKLLPR